MVKLRKILKAIHIHFPQPPEDVLIENIIDKFLDDPDICEDGLSDIAAKEGNSEFIFSKYFPVDKGLKSLETLAPTRYSIYTVNLSMVEIHSVLIEIVFGNMCNDMH